MILYNLVVAPIEMIVDWVFTFFSIKFDEFGIIGAVLGVSLVINFLALPIYNVADRLQEKERKIAKSMEGQIKRIKQTFKGDERFMMLQAYYHECKYNPVYTLRSSLSILIEFYCCVPLSKPCRSPKRRFFLDFQRFGRVRFSFPHRKFSYQRSADSDDCDKSYFRRCLLKRHNFA